MRSAAHCSRRFAPASIAVLAALILAFSAISARGAPPPTKPGGSDTHLTGLSADELRALLERYKAERKFSVDSTACFNAFVDARQSGLRKDAEDRTPEQASAAKADRPKAMRAWVEDCLKKKGWTSIGEAATADAFGKVELSSPVGAPPAGGVGKAWTVEDDWISEVHESSHVASRIGDAQKLGIDFKKWQRWGPVKDKIDKMVGETLLSSQQGLEAITDPDSMAASRADGRYLAARAKNELTEEEIELAKWALANLDKFDKFFDVLLDPIRGASEEAREYAHQLVFINSRISTITAMLASRTGTGGTGTSGTGTSGTPRGSGTAGEDGGTGPASCFAAGTQVALADGGERNIEDIRVGDRVLGQDGAVNTVTGIERPRLGDRLLYAINGGAAFVTAEHPFWTMAGWKAIDPTATARENPRLPVGKLAVGDKVAVAAISVARSAPGARLLPVSYAPTPLREIPIGTILGVAADPDTVVYNLILAGNHTYYANGYLVHNKGLGRN